MCAQLNAITIGFVPSQRPSHLFSCSFSVSFMHAFRFLCILRVSRSLPLLRVPWLAPPHRRQSYADGLERARARARAHFRLASSRDDRGAPPVQRWRTNKSLIIIFTVAARSLATVEKIEKLRRMKIESRNYQMENGSKYSAWANASCLNFISLLWLLLPLSLLQFCCCRFSFFLHSLCWCIRFSVLYCYRCLLCNARSSYIQCSVWRALHSTWDRCEWIANKSQISFCTQHLVIRRTIFFRVALIENITLVKKFETRFLFTCETKSQNRLKIASSSNAEKRKRNVDGIAAQSVIGKDGKSRTYDVRGKNDVISSLEIFPGFWLWNTLGQVERKRTARNNKKKSVEITSNRRGKLMKSKQSV